MKVVIEGIITKHCPKCETEDFEAKRVRYEFPISKELEGGFIALMRADKFSTFYIPDGHGGEQITEYEELGE